MHHVDRGPEPAGLKDVRHQYTDRWVRYCRAGAGPKPSDAKWRDFVGELEASFHGLCGYCEEVCKGEVDHFRPKGQFPERVYQWSNWIYSCHDCNHAKGDRWPSGGYVDPCARPAAQRPEEFFEFDTLTGEIKPRSGLSRHRAARAKRMIEDLKLNAGHHLKKRRWWVFSLREFLGRYDASHAGDRQFLRRVASRSAPLSSLTRAVLSEAALSW